MSEPVDPEALRLDLIGKTDAEASKLGEARYSELYLGCGRTGSLQAHDGETVIFYKDRYHHAFHTSPDRSRHAYSKAKVARDRIERLAWIGPLIEGRFSNYECWEVPLKIPEEGFRCFPGKRLYVSWSLGYVVWLEPLRKGGFKLSSCYCVPSGEIARYIKGGRKKWPLTH